MGFLFSKIEDILCKLRRNWGAVIVAVALMALGLVVGMVSVAKDCTCWWCQARTACIKIVLFKGFFAVFFRFLLNLSLLAVLIIALSWSSVTNYFKMLLCFVVGLFVGSYLRLFFILYSISGLLSGVLLFLLLGLLCLVAIVLSFIDGCQYTKVFSLADLIKVNVAPMYILAVSLGLVVAINFLVVRLLVIS